MFVANNEAWLARCLRVLSDELSLKLLHALGDGPAACVELAQRLQCDYQITRRRLVELCKAGFVQRQARSGYKGQAKYIACVEKVKAIFAAAMSYAGFVQGQPG